MRFWKISQKNTCVLRSRHRAAAGAGGAGGAIFHPAAVSENPSKQLLDLNKHVPPTCEDMKEVSEIEIEKGTVL